MANRMNNVPGRADLEPAKTATTTEGGGGLAVVDVQRNGRVRDTGEPVGTVRAGGFHHGVVMANRENAVPKDMHVAPVPALVTEGGMAVVMRNNNSRGDSGAMVTPDHEPVRAFTTAGHQSVVFPYQSEATGDRDPVATVTTRDRLALIVPHADGNVPRPAAREPAHTLTTKGKHAVVWSDEDIERCGFRMFELSEIAGAMAMTTHYTGGEYVVTGNKRERMAQYGNAVTPPVMAWIIHRLGQAGVDLSGIIDLFCGAGGSSLGATFAGGSLRLGLNHWRRAIETHAENFRDAEHDCADVAALSTRQIVAYLTYAKATVLIASPECTNHSLAKGALRRKPQAASIFDDGPGGDDEQDRSRATMWDVVRFAEQALARGRALEAIVVENVVDAFKWGPDDNGALFQAWLQSLLVLGYDHQIVWHNSMFSPPAGGMVVPQSRDRMYVVLWRKGAARPDLEQRPPAWCPHCEQVVPARQAWKKPGGTLWGRYGQQYLFACPSCHRPAIPGAFPADTIIDRSIACRPISEHKPKKCRTCGEVHPVACNTRARIGRGLERLASEPFAIRLNHGGVPKPLTLPLVTTTARHDMAMVMPAAGNTHERTPGNRARDAAERPLDTVHATHDRALVVPPMGSVAPRLADSEPAPTQTTTTRAQVAFPDA